MTSSSELCIERLKNSYAPPASQCWAIGRRDGQLFGGTFQCLVFRPLLVGYCICHCYGSMDVEVNCRALVKGKWA